MTSGSNIYYNLGNVGIGTTSPGYPLDINGIIRTNNSYYGLFSDTEYVLRSYNDSAIGDPEQFFIKHNLGSVDVDNVRGDINFLTTVDFNISGESITVKGTGPADNTDSNFIAFRRSDDVRIGYLGDGSSGGSTLQLVGDNGIQINGAGNTIDIKDNTNIEGSLNIQDTDFALVSLRRGTSGKGSGIIEFQAGDGTIVAGIGGAIAEGSAIL